MPRNTVQLWKTSTRTYLRESSVKPPILTDENNFFPPEVRVEFVKAPNLYYQRGGIPAKNSHSWHLTEVWRHGVFTNAVVQHPDKDKERGDRLWDKQAMRQTDGHTFG